MTLKLEDIDPKEDIRMTGKDLIGYLAQARIDELESLYTTCPEIGSDWLDDRITKLKELTGGV